MKDLKYNGTPMRWQPTRIRRVSGGVPLKRNEPDDVTAGDIRRALKDGYGFIIELQPDDGTRYSLMLAPLEHGCAMMQTGGGMIEPTVIVWYPTAPIEARCRNPWSATLLSWWMEGLRDGATD